MDILPRIPQPLLVITSIQRVLHDLANELQVEVVSCNSDGLRYAFILDRGQLRKLPTHIDFPFIDKDRLLARVVYSDNSLSKPTHPVDSTMVDDHTLMRQGVKAFLKVLDDIKLKDEVAFKTFCRRPTRHRRHR